MLRPGAWTAGVAAVPFVAARPRFDSSNAGARRSGSHLTFEKETF